jgi:phosphotriesterase-related protein
MTADPTLVQTVLGPVAPDRLGRTLMHEHLLASQVPHDGNSPGRTPRERSRWDLPITLENLHDVRHHSDLYRLDLDLTSREEAITELAPFTAAGGGCVVDATSLGIGRDPTGLRAISEAAGVHVVMGCGFYCAAYHPPEIAGASEEELADRMISDLTVGSEGVVAGIIGEIGLTWPLHPDEARVLRAAVRAQRATGAAVTIHPGRHPEAPMAAMRAVIAAGGDPERTIIDHLDARLACDRDYEELAATGCYLELDLFGYESAYFPAFPDFDMPNDGLRVRRVLRLLELGYGGRILLSGDMGLRHHRKGYGGPGYDHILVNVVPLMLRRGIPGAQIDAFLVDNPARALARPFRGAPV